MRIVSVGVTVAALLALLVVGLALPGPRAAGAEAVADERAMERAATKLDPELLAALQAAPDTELTVIVRLGSRADLTGAMRTTSRVARARAVVASLQQHAATSQAPLRAALEGWRAEGKVTSFRPYFIFNGLAVTAAPGTIWAIAARDDVESIEPNRRYRLDPAPAPTLEAIALAWGVERINADDVWATYGVIGNGVLVANIDSGVEFSHPSLVGQYAGSGVGPPDHDYHWFDAITGGGSPFDDNGHGTHTMGTIVGGDGPGPVVEDIGVAPGARWIAARAFDSRGFGDAAGLHAAFEWMIAPCPVGVPTGDPSCDPARAPDVLNNSWGSSNGARTEFQADVQALRAAGIFPIFSAGNSGPGAGTIGSPASFAESFAVGATAQDDSVAGFSSRGPSPLTSDTKPEIAAPGVAIRSALPGGGYGENNGTSMSAPHVTGAAALLLALDPSLDLPTLESLLTSTARDLGAPGPDPDSGYGLLDALGAARRLADSGTIEGSVRDASDSSPLAGATVALGGPIALDTQSAADGSYRFDYLLAGTYSVSAALYGYAPITVSSVSVISDQVTTLDFDLVPLPTYTLSGTVRDASDASPIAGAVVTVRDTPLAPVVTDGAGSYSIVVAQGRAEVEVAAFGYATGVRVVDVTTDTTLDVDLQPLPPVLLIDDDEGTLRNFAPHVEQYYFSALDASGYNYTYWDIEAEGGAPDLATVRQYAAVVWFGGEWGRIKDISDATQADTLMQYLDLGGRLLYVSQAHTFYFGADAPCDIGNGGPCRFTRDYLGVANWLEDQKADLVHGVPGDPVGAGIPGTITMRYPGLFSDFSDDITGQPFASLAMTATRLSTGGTRDVAYSVVSPTAPYRTVFMATPLEAMPATDAADTMFAVMEWFGVDSLAEGLTLSPATQKGLALPGGTISATLRLRNLGATPENFTLHVDAAPWPTTLWSADFATPISSVGPIAPNASVDIGVLVEVPPGASPGLETSSLVRARAGGATPHEDTATIVAAAKMDYHMRDSDQCDSGVHFDWIDATGGQAWILDEDVPGVPEFVSVPLPQPFVFYNETYDHLWINDHAIVLFGDDNLYDDRFPSGNPPIPNPTLLDPNGAIYLAWGNIYWHPSFQDPAAAVYTHHETSGGRNDFVIEYHRYENLSSGDADTMQVILDLDTLAITLQYQTITDHDFTVVGIENQIGTEGFLYVNDQQPPERALHDGLAIRFTPAPPGEVLEARFVPAQVAGSGGAAGVAEYTMVLSSTSSLADSYTLELGGNQWPTTLWDETFTTPIGAVGPVAPCGTARVGVRVQTPGQSAPFATDDVTLRARSQRDPLVVASAAIHSDNAGPEVALPPTSSVDGAPGQTVTHSITLTNTGNVTDSFTLSLTGATWPTMIVAPGPQSAPIPPGASLPVEVAVQIPAGATEGTSDGVTLVARGQGYPATSAASELITRVTSVVAVGFDQPSQSADGPADWTLSYLVTLRNRGSASDQFDLSTIAADWTTTIWNDSFTQQLTRSGQLAPDGTQRIGVRVRIPPGVAAPELDAALLRATSLRDPTVRGHALLVSRVSPPTPGTHAAAVEPLGAWQESGGPTDATLRITNAGSVADRFRVTANGGGAWQPTNLPATSPPLAPGQSWTLDVQLAPQGAPPAVEELLFDVAVVGQPGGTARSALILLAPPPPSGAGLRLPIILR